MSANQQYILTLKSNNLLKEVAVSLSTPVIKIGTLQECDIRLKRELFDLPVCLDMKFDGQEWHIYCDKTIHMNSVFVKNCRECAIHHGDVLEVYRSDEQVLLFELTFSYDFSSVPNNFDTILDIRSINRFAIGNTNSDIVLNSDYIEDEYVEITREDGELFINPTNAYVTLNGVRISDKRKMEEFDFLGVGEHNFYYKNQVFYTTLHPQMEIHNIPLQPLREETLAFEYPKLNRSPRMLYNFNKEPIEILNPPKMPSKPRENLLMQIAPAFAMLAVIIVVRGGMLGGSSIGGGAFLIFSVATMSVGILTSIMNFVHSKKKYKKDLIEWEKDYKTYISKKEKEIEEEQREEVSSLVELYPSKEEMRNFVKTFSGRLFERSPEDEDFLHTRIGLGSIPAIREIRCNKAQTVKIANELVEIPEKVKENYSYLKEAPVLVHLKEAGTVGVVGSKEEQYDFFKSLLLDICVEHSYEDVEVIVLIPRGEQEKYDWIKWFPHIKQSGGSLRGIVCDDESRDHVFEYLYSLFSQRFAQLEGDEKESSTIPHYVVFALEEYAIKTHPLYKYAENSENVGLSFVYFKEYKESLPKQCKEIVELSKDGGILRLREDKKFACNFSRTHIKDESIKFVAERLAPVYCEKIALSSRLTSNITLFELLNILSPEDLNLIDRWENSDVQHSLSAALGVDTKGQIIALDLHEKAHGPHGLVAGTTGSGKSEIMQSYILSAATNFHPHDLSFVLIDFKGGGMANQFENLPHLIGKITDIDSHEINRSLLSIRAELEKRKRLFSQYDVNHIDKYIEKYHLGVAKIALPHLVLIVDEFAELKAEQPEFMKELISTARIGRSLGIHLILATQKPSGQVNEQIWSNSKFKLCLKVATKQDSNEVIRSPLASEIIEPGRAYFQVGNNEIFTLFQSAYSGASAMSDKNGNTREFEISEVSFTGKRTKVFEKKTQRRDDGMKLTQLKALVDYIGDYCETQNVPKLPSICLPPLPDLVDYQGIKDDFSILNPVVRIGIYDDPSNQVQPEVSLNLAEGNIIVIGDSQTGKTCLLQSVLRTVSESVSPKDVFVYILDFASKALKIYEPLHHVGGVITDTDEEKIKNLFRMLEEIIKQRKEMFSNLGVSSYESYIETTKESIPRILVMVDNLVTFKDLYPDYENAMLNLCREGLALGITLIATAKQTTGISYRYLSNFSTRLSFTCTESSEYGNLFDRCRMRPKNLEGRGLVSINKIIYEYQAYLPFDGVVEEIDGEKIRTEVKRIEQVREFIQQINARCANETAKPIPSIPAVLTIGYFEAMNHSLKLGEIPVGLTYQDIGPVTIDIERVGTVGIYGRESFGKTNLMGIILEYLQQHVFDMPCEAYIVDSYERRLSRYEECGYVEKYTIDCLDFEQIVQEFADEAENRMNILQRRESLKEEPLLLCIVKNPKIYSQDSVSRDTVDAFKKLVADAKELKMCFIFSDIENNGDYSVSEIMKMVREFSQHFLLDDIKNVKLFGTAKLDLQSVNTFKKQKEIVLGDGFLYDERLGLQKIKLIKNERS